MKWISTIAAACLIGAAGWAQDAGNDASGGRLTVTGEGRVESVPDMATITLGVTSEAKSAAEAMDRTSRATAAVLERLKAAGIADRDMQTRDLHLSPIWENRSSSSGNTRPRIAGYEASNTVLVRVRALDDLGRILDDVVEGGANLFQGLSFGLQNPGPVQDEARRAAVADAMRKAALYAGAAGLTLGPVLELAEAGAVAPMPVAMERIALMSEPVPVAAGEVSTVAHVTMVLRISGP